MVVDSSGAAHIAYTYYDDIQYVQVSPGGIVSPIKILDKNEGPINSFSLYMGFDAQGSVIIFGGYDQSGYWLRTTQGEWSHHSLDIPGDVHIYHSAFDSSGNLHILALSYYMNVSYRYYWMRDSSTSQVIQRSVAPSEYTGPFTDFLILPNGRLGFIYIDRNVSTLPRPIKYQEISVAADAAQSILRQTVTIPPDLHKPTLSWYFRQNQYVPYEISRFEITITPTTGDSQTLFTSNASTADWTHAWADLSAWAGQEVTLDFTLYQAAGEGHIMVELDEVSLAEWTTPVVTGLSPTHLTNLPNLGPCTITGENLMPGLQVIINGQHATILDLNTTTGELTFSVPAGLIPGTHPVQVVNPGGASAHAPQPLIYGSFVYIPRVTSK